MSNKRWHIVLASVLFAFLTWLSVNMRRDYVAVRQFPVVIENLKEGKALKYPVPRRVSVRFNGSGWLIAGLYISPGLRYFIDASSLTAEPFTIRAKDVLEHLNLPFNIQPVDIKPDTITLALDDYIEKRVPVHPRIFINYHQGYGPVDSMHVTPPSIVVGGAKDVVERLFVWNTVFERFSELQTSIDMQLPLEEPENYSLNIPRQSVHIQQNVQPYAEKVFPGIPVTASLVPSNREVIFIPPRLDIIVRGGIDQLAKLTPRDFSATVNFETLLQDSSTTMRPSLVAPPEVSVISRKPDRFQYIIRKRLQ